MISVVSLMATVVSRMSGGSAPMPSIHHMAPVEITPTAHVSGLVLIHSAGGVEGFTVSVPGITKQDCEMCWSLTVE